MTRFIFALFAGLAAITVVSAQDPAGPTPMEAKLRDTLKTTMLQLQTTQGERDTAVAEKAAAEARIKELEAQVKKLIQEATDTKEMTEKKAEELGGQITTLTNSNAQHKLALDKWKEGAMQMQSLAQSTEAKRVKLLDQTVQLQRRIDAQQAHNVEMYRLATEILDRYEKLGLGTALLRREPFTGLAKVKLQTFVQDYGDKVADQRIYPEGPGAAKKKASQPAAASKAEPARQAPPAEKR